MALPNKWELQKMDYSYLWQPFVNVPAKWWIDTSKMDYSYLWQPFVTWALTGYAIKMVTSSVNIALTFKDFILKKFINIIVNTSNFIITPISQVFKTSRKLVSNVLNISVTWININLLRPIINLITLSSNYNIITKDVIFNKYLKMLWEKTEYVLTLFNWVLVKWIWIIVLSWQFLTNWNNLIISVFRKLTALYNSYIISWKNISLYRSILIVLQKWEFVLTWINSLLIRAYFLILIQWNYVINTIPQVFKKTLNIIVNYWEYVLDWTNTFLIKWYNIITSTASYILTLFWVEIIQNKWILSPKVISIIKSIPWIIFSSKSNVVVEWTNSISKNILDINKNKPNTINIIKTKPKAQ